MKTVKGIFAKLRRFWDRVEPSFLIIGATSAFLVWAYSNFATASSVNEAKAELRAYVDDKHGQVKEDLGDIKAELHTQRQLQERILLKLTR